MTCEESPCENGGTCSRHVRDYMCICREGYSGSLCQGQYNYTIMLLHDPDHSTMYIHFMLQNLFKKIKKGCLVENCTITR